MLSKSRIEALSDGLFAIVLTLLVIEIHVPILQGPITNEVLWHALIKLTPVFIGYLVSFVVLVMFWLSHNFFFSFFVKEINRQLLILNMLYLGLLAIIPFSALLIGEYPQSSLAVFLYGLNIFCIGLMNIWIFHYALQSKEIDTTHVPHKLIQQAKIRGRITPLCTFVGMVFAFISIPVALVLYAFPIIFNLVPGSLTALEKLFGFEIGAGKIKKV